VPCWGNPPCHTVIEVSDALSCSSNVLVPFWDRDNDLSGGVSPSTVVSMLLRNTPTTASVKGFVEVDSLPERDEFVVPLRSVHVAHRSQSIASTMVLKEKELW
jgi:hypothetical protein